MAGTASSIVLSMTDTFECAGPPGDIRGASGSGSRADAVHDTPARLALYTTVGVEGLARLHPAALAEPAAHVNPTSNAGTSAPN
jgi:hypothetical protein